MNNKKIIKIPIEQGYYEFKLAKLLADKQLSINKVVRDTGTDFKVLQRLLRGDSARIDITVLARLCDYLDCDMDAIIEYKR
ncbi:MAG: helix-turn-helix transcriptional regulator [Lachnospiraceae bacterium]|nr:helix-turn-helix transcriptional regulator [Lachnospiraceae bacterium]